MKSLGGKDKVDSDFSPGINILAKGMGISLAGLVFGRSIQVLNQVLLARILRPDLYGSYAIGWSIFQILIMLAPLGLDQASIRFGSMYVGTDAERTKKVILQSIVVSGVSGFSIGGVFYIFGSNLAAEVFKDGEIVVVVKVLAALVGFASILRVASASTKISQRMQFSVIAEVMLVPFVQVALILIFDSVFGLGLREALASAFVAIALGMAFALLFVNRLFPHVFRWPNLSKPMISDLLAFSVPTITAGFLGTLILRSGPIFVGSLLSSHDAGIYQASLQVALISAVILTSVNAIFAPMISKLHAERQYEELNELFKISTKWALYASLPFVLVMVVAPALVLTALFGAPYVNGEKSLILLALGQLVNTGTGAVGYLLVMTGHERNWLIISLTAFISNVVLNFVLAPYFGISGSAFSIVASYCVLFLSALFVVHGRLGMWPYDRRFRKGIVAAVGTTGVIYWMKISISTVHLGSPTKLLMVTVLSLCAFVGLLLLLKLDPEDRLLFGILTSTRKFGDIRSLLKQ